MKLPRNAFFVIAYLIILIYLLVAAIAPESLEPKGPSPLTWTVPALATDTPTSTPTPGWYDDLPTPSYPTRTIAPSETPTLTKEP